MRIAIIGGGWAGLSAACSAVGHGHAVTLFEMAAELGGRARTVERETQSLDNGQHILIGAYACTLEMLRGLGLSHDEVFKRLPLALVNPQGQGLVVPAPSSPTRFLASVMRHDAWSLHSRWAVLRFGVACAIRRFKCESGLTVEALTQRLPEQVRKDFIDPLCEAALNTRANQACAQVFLRVMRDTVLGERGSADLLLPSRGLGDLMPRPALHWLRSRGATVHLRKRVSHLESLDGLWLVQGQKFDGLILACSATEAARLAEVHNPQWALLAKQLPYEPITTVYVKAPGARLRFPMVLLTDGPAQFAFDHGQMGLAKDRFAFVISAARPFRELGKEGLAQAVLHQAAHQFPAGTWPHPPVILAVLTEQRATFSCLPNLRRPPGRVTQGLWAAGDYVQGPYPATLEGAVRSGLAAVKGLES